MKHGMPHFYRPQTKFAKVMFSQVFVCPWGGMHVMPSRHACPLGTHAPRHTHPQGMHAPLACMSPRHAHPLGHAHPPRHAHLLGTYTPRARMPPPRWIPRDVLNERAVCILLECILVARLFISIFVVPPLRKNLSKFVLFQGNRKVLNNGDL